MTMPLYIEIIGVHPPDRTYGEKPVNFLFGHHLEAIEFSKDSFEVGVAPLPGSHSMFRFGDSELNLQTFICHATGFREILRKGPP